MSSPPAPVDAPITSTWSPVGPPEEPRTLYRRTLPLGLVPFASSEGRAIFREALTAGTMEGYFALAEQFHTQSEPSFCGLGTLVIALNALAIDPGRTWKGSWRWFAEDMLDCCRPLEDIQRQGITLAEFVCLARCNGARAEAWRPDDTSIDAFRAAVRDAASGVSQAHIVVSYDRATLGQSGAGHFSPIGGFHEARDLVLVLDVARFKYPPHWVPVERLWSALAPLDPTTGKSRGFVRLTRGETPTPTLCNLAAEKCAWSTAALTVLRALTSARDAGWSLEGLSPSALGALTTPKHLEGEEVRRAREELLAEIRAVPFFCELAAAVLPPVLPEIVMLLVLAAPDELLVHLSADARAELARWRGVPALPPRLRAEVDAVRSQLQTLIDYCHTG